MIEIKINEAVLSVERSVTVFELMQEYSPDADQFFVDGAAVDSSFIITSDATLLLLKKGQVPLEQEMEGILVGRHSAAVHKALKKSVVGIAGLGGLGSHVVAALARIGVGRIVGFDFDVVAPSNINRQYYFLDQIGMKKTEALKQTIHRINPFMTLDFTDMRITETNVNGLFEGCDILIEAFDTDKGKAMLFNAWQKYYSDRYYIGVSGIAGFKDEPPLTIRKLGEKAFMIGDMTNEPVPGRSLMAPRVGMAAHMQANLAVKLLVEINA